MDYIGWIILGAVVAIMLVWCIIPNNKEYICPKCQKTHLPTKFQLIKTAHIGEKEYLKCPHCGERSAMSPAHKN